MIPLVYQSVNCYVMRFFRETLVSTAVADYSRQYIGELYRTKQYSENTDALFFFVQAVILILL